jgi:hypothetical protein
VQYEQNEEWRSVFPFSFRPLSFLSFAAGVEYRRAIPAERRSLMLLRTAKALLRLCYGSIKLYSGRLKVLSVAAYCSGDINALLSLC